MNIIIQSAVIFILSVISATYFYKRGYEKGVLKAPAEIYLRNLAKGYQAGLDAANRRTQEIVEQIFGGTNE